MKKEKNNDIMGKDKDLLSYYQFANLTENELASIKNSILKIQNNMEHDGLTEKNKKEYILLLERPFIDIITKKIKGDEIPFLNNFIDDKFICNGDNNINIWNINLFLDIVKKFNIELDFYKIIELFEKNQKFLDAVRIISENKKKFSYNGEITLIVEAYELNLNSKKNSEENNFDEQFEITSSGYANINYTKSECDGFRDYMKEIDGRLLTKEEEQSAFQIIKNGTQKEKDKAREYIINHNLRLVINIAKHFNGRGLPLQDLVQEGNIGLLIAIEKFDYTKGYKLSTYATWWIKEYIIRSIADKSKIIRIPAHLVDDINKLKKVILKHETTYAKTPNVSEITSEIPEFSETYVKYLLQVTQIECTSLNQTIEKNGEASNVELLDYIPDEKQFDKEYIEGTYLREFKQFIENKCGLTPRELRIIKMRYGFYNDKIYTLEEVAKIENVTRERIRQIQKTALRRIRMNSKLKTFADNFKNIKDFN